MDKLRTSSADAISDLPDGASIAVSGFGPSADAPFSLLTALDERGILVTDLAQFRRKNGGLAVEQVAPGFTKEEVLALTGIDAATGMTAKAGNP